MSNPDDSSRLSETLERLLGGTTTSRDEPSDDRSDSTNDVEADGRNGDDGAADRSDTEATGSDVTERYELPEIVPATADPTPVDEPSSVAPTLPAREMRPGSRPGSTEPVTAARTDRSTAASVSPAPRPAAPPPTPVATSWADHVPTTATGPQLRAPGRRPRVRRVTRVLRHIDPWSTFKVALLFSGVAYVVVLTSGVLLWRVADSTGTLDNVERWFTQFGWETFELQGGEIFRNAWVIGLFGVVFATGGAVLLVTLFNLVSDIVGGVRMTVLEEEVVERTASSRRRYIVRSGADLAAATTSRAPSWSVDDDGSDAPTPAPERDADAADRPAATWSTAQRSRQSDVWASEPTSQQPPTRSTTVQTPSGPRADDDWSVD